MGWLSRAVSAAIEPARHREPFCQNGSESRSTGGLSDGRAILTSGQGAKQSANQVPDQAVRAIASRRAASCVSPHGHITTVPHRRSLLAAVECRLPEAIQALSLAANLTPRDADGTPIRSTGASGGSDAIRGSSRGSRSSASKGHAFLSGAEPLGRTAGAGRQVKDCEIPRSRRDDPNPDLSTHRRRLLPATIFFHGGWFFLAGWKLTTRWPARSPMRRTRS